ncbi:TPA: UvrD-helicase domain-containing protein [Enterococcus hirae]
MIIKIAGAGAGKTTTMAERIIVKQKELPIDKNIYCITFTNNAVNCIAEKLNEYYDTIPRNIKLSTIHSFLYQDIIKPYYYLLYGKQYEQISSIELDSVPKFKNFKISELERSSILHVEVFTERAKWIICKKSTDKKKEKEKRKVLLNNFSKYCGYIFIDEAQDMDKHMLEIVKGLDVFSIPIELMGDPKQDLKGCGSLRKMVLDFPEKTKHINTCYRCPQKHLDISNTLVTKSEKQESKKDKGILNIYFESDIDVKTLIAKENFDLMYISQKNEKYSTTQRSESNYKIETLFHEIEQFLLIHDLTKNKNVLLVKQLAYYFTIEMLDTYLNTQNSTLAMKKIGDTYTMDTKTYAKIINSLKSNVKESNDKISVSSIDKIKGREGENCLFILTNDLAPYLFGDKKNNNKTKNRLYVALTRSLDKLSIVVSKGVEELYSKDFVSNYFKQFI